MRIKLPLIGRISIWMLALVLGAAAYFFNWFGFQATVQGWIAKLKTTISSKS